MAKTYIDEYVEMIEGEHLKKTIKSMPTEVKAAISTVINQLVNKMVTEMTKAEKRAIDDAIELKKELRLLQDVKTEKDYYQGFYWVVNGEVDYYNLCAKHIDGINDALEYMRKMPTQVVQHYGDPNPKEKITNYYHHKSK